jgi:hypothetical protein
VQVTGAGEIVQVLRDFGKIAEPARMKRALLSAGGIIADEMRRVVRKKSGVLAQDIGVLEIKGSGSDATAAVAIGPQSPYLFLRARNLQDGYLRRNKRTGAVSHIPGYPFVQPAVDAKGDAAEAAFVTEMTQGVEGLS